MINILHKHIYKDNINCKKNYNKLVKKIVLKNYNKLVKKIYVQKNYNKLVKKN